jgi:hypothetical protein
MEFFPWGLLYAFCLIISTICAWSAKSIKNRGFDLAIPWAIAFLASTISLSSILPGAGFPGDTKNGQIIYFGSIAAQAFFLGLCFKKNDYLAKKTATIKK